MQSILCNPGQFLESRMDRLDSSVHVKEPVDGQLRRFAYESSIITFLATFSEHPTISFLKLFTRDRMKNTFALFIWFSLDVIDVSVVFLGWKHFRIVV